MQSPLHGLAILHYTAKGNMMEVNRQKRGKPPVTMEKLT